MDHLAAVKVSTKWGFIGSDGKMVITPQFLAVGDFCNGRAAARLGTKYGFVDRTGTMVITPQFDDAQQFNDDVAAVRTGSRHGYVNGSGNYVWGPAPAGTSAPEGIEEEHKDSSPFGP